MTAIVRSRAHRRLVIAVALAAFIAPMLAIPPGADAAKPQQVLDAEVRAVSRVCEVVIDTTLNRKGSMKNDIRVVVPGTGIDHMMPARRGAVLRVVDTLPGPGAYTGRVESVDPRSGDVEQTVPLGQIVCG